MNIIRRIRDPYIFEKIYEYVIHFKMFAVFDKIKKRDTCLTIKYINKIINENDRYKKNKKIFSEFTTKEINRLLEPSKPVSNMYIHKYFTENNVFGYADFGFSSPRFITLMNFYNRNKNSFVHHNKNYKLIKSLNNKGITSRVGFSDVFKFEFLMIYDKKKIFNFNFI
jgi:hypothetical protein